MPRTVTQIRCPNCGTPIQASVEELIDVAQDPGAKARLLSGSLNQVRCPTCKYEGQLATPLVYHDPSKELLLTFIPVEAGLRKDEQERLLGKLINQAVNRLAPEQRKAYILQPQATLTVQGLVDRVLQADGITREQVEAQRAKMRLFEDLLRTPEAGLETFASQHEADLDAAFFQLAALALQSVPDEHAREALGQRLERILALSSYGKRLQTQEAELRAAAESLRAAGQSLTLESLLDLFTGAPNEDRVIGLTSLVRPALDYAFFQALSERIDKAEPSNKERLLRTRDLVLEIVEEIDAVQESRARQAAELLKSVAQAPDLDQALESAAPLIDEYFLGTLQANLRAAKERGDTETQGRLEQVNTRLQSLLREALPAGLLLAEEALRAPDAASAQAVLEHRAAEIDDQTLGALLSAAQELEQAQTLDRAAQVRDLHRQAVRLSMQARLGAQAK
jgi:hypothetical protein